MSGTPPQDPTAPSSSRSAMPPEPVSAQFDIIVGLRRQIAQIRDTVATLQETTPALHTMRHTKNEHHAEVNPSHMQNAEDMKSFSQSLLVIIEDLKPNTTPPRNPGPTAEQVESVALPELDTLRTPRRSPPTPSEASLRVASSRALSSISLLPPAAEPPLQPRRRAGPSLASLTKNAAPEFYSGKPEERSSIRIQRFTAGVCRMLRVSGVDDPQEMVDVAKCFLKGSASTWINREEANGAEMTSLDDLQKALIEEYVPDNEDAQARSKLMRLRLRGSLERHISQFRDLIELCGPHPGDAYNYFFMSFPDEYRAELAKQFSKGSVDLKAVYNFVRNLEIADFWRSTAPSATRNKLVASTKLNQADAPLLGTASVPTPSTPRDINRDPAALSWGPCDKKSAVERKIYRSQDRCMTCGKHGWSDPSHPCRANSPWADKP